MVNKKALKEQYTSGPYSLLIKMEYIMKSLIRFAGIITILLTILLTVLCIAFADNAPKEMKLKPAEKKLLNTLFSNFSEVFVEPFKKNEISDSALIQFALSHNYLNNNKFFVKGGDEYQVKIKASYIDSAALKFFGRKIVKHQSVGEIDYKDGWYYTTDATGEAYFFSQIVNLYDNGKSMYTATVNIYSAGSGWTGNVHGDEKEWKKASPDDVPELSEVMKCTLQKVKENGKSRYILVDYIKIK
jgi:hypothetical protein